MAVCVLQGRVLYVKDYPKAANYCLLTKKEEKNDYLYSSILKRMLSKFLCSDITKKTPWDGQVEWQRIFYLKQHNSDLLFYPNFEFRNFENLLFEYTSLKINRLKSKNNNETVKLHLEFWLDLP